MGNCGARERMEQKRPRFIANRLWKLLVAKRAGPAGELTAER